MKKFQKEQKSTEITFQPKQNSNTCNLLTAGSYVCIHFYQILMKFEHTKRIVVCSNAVSFFKTVFIIYGGMRVKKLTNFLHGTITRALVVLLINLGQCNTR